MLVTIVQAQTADGKQIATGFDEVIDPARPYWYRVDWGSIRTFASREERDQALEADLADGDDDPTPPAAPLALPAPRPLQKGTAVRAHHGRWATYGIGEVIHVDGSQVLVWWPEAHREGYLPVSLLYQLGEDDQKQLRQQVSTRLYQQAGLLLLYHLRPALVLKRAA